MMKFFRKHNKKLLALFMTLLMIVFVGGSALDNLLQPQVDNVVATSDLGEISFLDQQAAERTTQIMSAIGLPWRRPFGAVGVPLELIDWVLLTREAERLSTTPNVAAVQSTMQLQIEDIARRIKAKPEHILNALAQYAAVQEAAVAISGSTEPSEAAIRAAARQAFEKVQVKAVVLPVAMFEDSDAEFTEAQIEAQYEEFREREGGEGLQFGYYVPEAIKVQHVKIDRDAIAAQMAEDKGKYLAKMAERFFVENRETHPAFRRTPVEDPLTYSASTTEPGGPLAGPPEPRFLRWPEAKETALDLVAKREADIAAGRLADWLVQRLAEEWLDAERGENLYKKVPDRAANLSHYEEILGNIPRTIAYPDAVSIAVTDFFSRNDADEVPEVGGATFRSERGDAFERFANLAFRSEWTIPKIPEERDTNLSDYLSKFQTCRYPLTDEDGNVYVFRVVDGRPGHVPESLDEVRDRVVADLRLRRALDAARARAESLRSCDPESGLALAYESDPELAVLRETEAGRDSGYFEPAPFARATQYEAARGLSGEAAGDATTFVPGGLGMLPRRVVEAIFAMEYAPEPTAVFELPERATLLVVQWVETIRPDGIEFESNRTGFVAQMTRAREQEVIAAWFDPEKIRARHGFTLVTN